jgi:RNA polymerase sigma-70 factor (ECF subfamily)
VSPLPSYQALDDQKLIQQFRTTGDSVYVGELFKRYSHLIFGVCMKYLKDEDESKDAAMQIFEKLLKELPRHEIQQFKPWLHSVTKFHCLMLLRTGKKEVRGMDPALMEIEGSMHPDGIPTEETIEKEQKLVLLEKYVTELDEHQQQCIRLFYLEEKSYQEVSEITGYSMNQVKSFIQNGKRNLKIMITRHENDGP